MPATLALQLQRDDRMNPARALCGSRSDEMPHERIGRVVPVGQDSCLYQTNRNLCAGSLRRMRKQHSVASCLNFLKPSQRQAGIAVPLTDVAYLFGVVHVTESCWQKLPKSVAGKVPLPYLTGTYLNSDLNCISLHSNLTQPPVDDSRYVRWRLRSLSSRGWCMHCSLEARGSGNGEGPMFAVLREDIDSCCSVCGLRLYVQLLLRLRGRNVHGLFRPPGREASLAPLQRLFL